MTGDGVTVHDPTGANFTVENALSTVPSAQQVLFLQGFGPNPNSFSATSVVTARCRDNPSFPTGDDGPFNKLVATGTGEFNGSPGYLFGIQIGDYGDDAVGEVNPAADWVSFTIVDGSNGNVVWQGTGDVSNSSPEEIFSGFPAT